MFVKSPSRMESSSVILNISIMVGLEVRAKFQQLLQLLGKVQSIWLISHPFLFECRQMMKVRVTPHCLLRADCLDLVNHMKTFNSRDNQALCRHPFQWSASLRKERKQIPKNGSPSQTTLAGKWKSRIWKNPDANTETETNPEMDRLTRSATGSDPGSVLFYFLFIYYLFILLPIFLLLPIA